MGFVRLLSKDIKLIRQLFLVYSLPKMPPAFSRRRNTSYGDGYAQRKQSRNQKRQLSSLFPHPKMAIEAIEQGMIWAWSAQLRRTLFARVPNATMSQTPTLRILRKPVPCAYKNAQFALAIISQEAAWLGKNGGGGSTSVHYATGAHPSYHPVCPQRQTKTGRCSARDHKAGRKADGVGSPGE